MFIVGMSNPRLLALAAEMPRHVLVHVLEHRLHAGDFAFAQSAVGGCFRIRGAPLLRGVLLRRLVARTIPFAERNQVLLQPLDGIAQWPTLRLICRAIARGIVAG